MVLRAGDVPRPSAAASSGCVPRSAMSCSGSDFPLHVWFSLGHWYGMHLVQCPGAVVYDSSRSLQVKVSSTSPDLKKVKLCLRFGTAQTADTAHSHNALQNLQHSRSNICWSKPWDVLTRLSAGGKGSGLPGTETRGEGPCGQ